MQGGIFQSFEARLMNNSYLNSPVFWGGLFIFF